MKRWSAFLMLLVLSGGLLALLACAAQEKALPGEGPAPAAPGPPAQAILPRKDAWEQEWERVLEAAKKEGKVVLAGPTGADRRRALTEPFQRKYGITVEYQGFSGAEFPGRIRAEREAGQFLWDIFVGGTTTQVTALYPMGAMAPIEPAFILPEVKDLKNWREGKLRFVIEKERMGLVMVLGTSEEVFINKRLVNPDEFRSYKDLLNPKWKGKIVVGRDPRIGGPGQGAFQFFYVHPELGPDFIRALAKQDLAILRDDRQAGQWLGEGRYPIALGIGEPVIKSLIDAGVPAAPLDPRKIKEGAHISPGAGAVTLLTRPPHPNAVKLYLNWLLSKEGQTEFAKAMHTPSWRVDVPTDFVDPWVVPQPGFMELYGEKELGTKQPFLALLKEIFGE